MEDIDASVALYAKAFGFRYDVVRRPTTSTPATRAPSRQARRRSSPRATPRACPAVRRSATPAVTGTGSIRPDPPAAHLAPAQERRASAATRLPPASRPAAIDQNAPSPWPGDAFGNFTAGADQAMPQLPPGPVRWALANLCPHAKIASACDGPLETTAPTSSHGHGFLAILASALPFIPPYQHRKRT